MSRERLGCYIHGGAPSGSSHAYPGSRWTDEPLDDASREIPGELVFGGTSRTWGGGVAFLDADIVPSVPTKSRLYLMRLGQFEDIVAQENWLVPGTITIQEPPVSGRVEVGEGLTYGLVVSVGECEGLPVLTVTKARATEPRKPTGAYLRHIGAGLAQAHGMGPAETASYLVTKPGIRGEMSAGEVEAVLRGSA